MSRPTPTFLYWLVSGGKNLQTCHLSSEDMLRCHVLGRAPAFAKGAHSWPSFSCCFNKLQNHGPLSPGGLQGHIIERVPAGGLARQRWQRYVCCRLLSSAVISTRQRNMSFRRTPSHIDASSAENGRFEQQLEGRIPLSSAEANSGSSQIHICLSVGRGQQLSSLMALFLRHRPAMKQCRGYIIQHLLRQRRGGDWPSKFGALRRWPVKTEVRRGSFPPPKDSKRLPISHR
jgi:hypothetical protein